MKTKLLLILLAIFISSPLTAMKKRQIAVSAAGQQITEQTALSKRRKIPTVKLYSSENKEFEVPLEIAQQATTLAEVAHFTTISSDEMALISKFMWALYVHKNLSGKQLLDALENEITVPDPVQLLRIAHYLDFTLLIEFLARLIAKKEDGEAQMALLTANPQISEKVKAYLGAYYFLLKGKELPGIDPEIYSLSIQDFLDYRPELIELCFDVSRTKLNLSELGIFSLDGLDKIPGIANVTSLNLSHNHIKTIKASDFQALLKLTHLNLSYNPINALPDRVFDKLKNLLVLNLKHLELQLIAPKTFEGPFRLQELYLSYNAITQLADFTFGFLLFLKILHLDHNQIGSISANAFRIDPYFDETGVISFAPSDQARQLIKERLNEEIFSLPLLRELYLNNNRIVALTNGVFDWVDVTILTMNNNLIGSLNPNVFEHIEGLKALYLSNNPLSDSNKDQIRKALPKDVNIHF